MCFIATFTQYFYILWSNLLALTRMIFYRRRASFLIPSHLDFSIRKIKQIGLFEISEILVQVTCINAVKSSISQLKLKITQTYRYCLSSCAAGS